MRALIDRDLQCDVCSARSQIDIEVNILIFSAQLRTFMVVHSYVNIKLGPDKIKCRLLPMVVSETRLKIKMIIVVFS